MRASDKGTSGSTVHRLNGWHHPATYPQFAHSSVYFDKDADSGSEYNPILVDGTLGELSYLSRLRSENGLGFYFHKIGTLQGGTHLMNKYSLLSFDGQIEVVLHTVQVDFTYEESIPPNLKLEPNTCLVMGVPWKARNFPFSLVDEIPEAIDGDGHGISDAPVLFSPKSEVARIIESNFGPAANRYAGMDELLDFRYLFLFDDTQPGRLETGPPLMRSRREEGWALSEPNINERISDALNQTMYLPNFFTAHHWHEELEVHALSSKYGWSVSTDLARKLSVSEGSVLDPVALLLMEALLVYKEFKSQDPSKKLTFNLIPFRVSTKNCEDFTSEFLLEGDFKKAMDFVDFLISYWGPHRGFLLFGDLVEGSSQDSASMMLHLSWIKDASVTRGEYSFRIENGDYAHTYLKLSRFGEVETFGFNYVDYGCITCGEYVFIQAAAKINLEWLAEMEIEFKVRWLGNYDFRLAYEQQIMIANQMCFACSTSTSL